MTMHDERRQITDALVHYVNERATPGDLADLRRMGPGRVPGFAFWKPWTEVVEPSVDLPADADALAEHETRWGVVLQALATLHGLASRGDRFGDALAHAGFSQLRLEQFLRSEGAALFDLIRKAAAYLAAKGQRVDPAQIAELALSTDPKSLERARRNVARSYFRTLHHLESDRPGRQS